MRVKRLLGHISPEKQILPRHIFGESQVVENSVWGVKLTANKIFWKSFVSTHMSMEGICQNMR